MSDREEIDRLNTMLVDLQTQLAFQEDTIAQLSGALARQQDDIATLQRHWRHVEERYASLQSQLPDSEKPPHY